MSATPKQEKLTLEYKTSSSNEPYFIIKAPNGELLVTSEMYSSKQARNYTVELFHINFVMSEVKDEDGKVILNS